MFLYHKSFTETSIKNILSNSIFSHLVTCELFLNGSNSNKYEITKAT